MYRLLCYLLLLQACNRPSADVRRQAEHDIRAADLAMSEQATKAGFNKTLLAYADTDAVKFTEGNLPVIGKTALGASWEGKPDTKAISWKPFKVEAAASGDLGYTLGYWKYAATDTVLYGNYYTIWKKQADGAWKFVLDGGNGTPLPPEEMR